MVTCKHSRGEARAFFVGPHRHFAQEGSRSRAAAHLHITQSAVSQALKRLEEQLDCVLIARSGRRFDLTETGEEVLRIAADIYGDISRLGTVLESRHDDLVGKICLLTVSGVQSSHYDEFLADFHVNHPNVELEVEVMGSSNIISSLLQKTATVGVGLFRLRTGWWISIFSCCGIATSA